MICPNCRKEVSETSGNCPFCNAPLYNNYNHQNTGYNNSPYNGNNYGNPVYNEIDNYLKTVKNIKIFSIVGIITSLGYLGVVFAILSIITISRLPDPSTLHIPYEAGYQFEQAQDTIKTAKTMNIISIVIFGISSVFGIISGILSVFM